MDVAAENVAEENLEGPLLDSKTKEISPSPTTRQERPKKSKKEDRSKKDDRGKFDDHTIDQLLRSLANEPTRVDDKVNLVCKKYVAIVEENKKLQFYIKQSDKRFAYVVKEKDQLRHEFNKAVLIKAKLENLCRELQKQNKAIKEESLLKIREEEERRKETQAKFQNTLGEITTLLQQNNDKNAKLRDDNISMSEKFKSIVSQYQLREQQVDKMGKQMALEQQLSAAKLQKAALEHAADRDTLLANIATLKMEVAQNKAKVAELQSIEAALRSQLAVYTDKYDEFQSALTKSNQVFGGFKDEMEKMSKKIQKLEKESLSWKTRWERTQSALIDMCSERAAQDTRLQRLQGLCRTLQAERTLLHNTLKENNIERPPLSALPPAPPAAPAGSSDAKVDAMAANCAQLKQSLAHLQNQLNVITTKTPEPAKAEPKKKSKSKKKKNAQTTEEQPENTEVQPEQNTVLSEQDTVQSEQNTVQSEQKEKKPVEQATEIVNGEVEKLVEAITNANLNLENTTPEMGIPVLEIPDVDIPDLEIPDVDIPDLEIPDVDIPEMEITETELPDLNDLELSESFSQSVNDEIAHLEEVKPLSEIAS